MNLAPSPTGPAPAWCLWRNPILRRFTRTRLRPRALGAALIITLMLAGFSLAIARSIGLREIESMEYNLKMGHITSVMMPSLADIERYCLFPLFILQAFILFVIGTGQVAGGMTADADEGTMDYVRLSPMTPLAKVIGYLFGLPIREWLMFACTLPFTAWGIWQGEVRAQHWMPVYAVLLTAAVLYHLTGLTAGTVLKNRRWAFLVSMGGVFLLYSVVPQLANLGLVYFEYLTISPVVMENLHGFMPTAMGSAFKATQSLLPDVRFFNLGFPEVVFTIFSQLVLCLTFVVMLWRRWRTAESHLLGKLWATGLCAWIQVLLLGCALPLISSGLIFFSKRMSFRFRSGFRLPKWTPALEEASVNISLYGTVTLLVMLLLIFMIAPGKETQDRGWRRKLRLGRGGIPFGSDESTTTPFVFVMAICGGIGWTIFAQKVIGSHWFPGQVLPVWTGGAFSLMLLTAGLCTSFLYELYGTKGVFLGGIFGGVLPILTGSVLATISNTLATASIWIMAGSPFVAPANAVTTVLPDALHRQAAMLRAGPRAFFFWQGIMVITTIWLFIKHRRAQQQRDLLAADGGGTTATEAGGHTHSWPRNGT